MSCVLRPYGDTNVIESKLEIRSQKSGIRNLIWDMTPLPCTLRHAHFDKLSDRAHRLAPCSLYLVPFTLLTSKRGSLCLYTGRLCYCLVY